MGDSADLEGSTVVGDSADLEGSTVVGDSGDLDSSSVESDPEGSPAAGGSVGSSILWARFSVITKTESKVENNSN